MLDPKHMRRDPAAVRASLGKKGFDLDLERLARLDSQRKALQLETEALQKARNAASRDIGRAKAAGDDIAAALAAMERLKADIENRRKQLQDLQAQWQDYQLGIPNLPLDDVPAGADESGNRVLAHWGEVPKFEFEPKDHSVLGASLDRGLDFPAGAKLAGARFAVMRGQVAMLHRALIQFMMDRHVRDHGYVEVHVPYLVTAESLLGTGQLPKFADDLFKLARESGHYLIPTAEVPVTNLARDEILPAAELPVKYVCHTPCFRAEAGSYGVDTKGMIRQHQFEKVELVQLTRSEQSAEALEELTGHAEKILQLLELPYRKVLLCGGDLGFAAAKTYDLEVWLPAQNTYREISSCSNCTDFQARRMHARWRNPATGKPELLHTLNGSGLAIGRTLVAILENMQTAAGTVRIPIALRDYLGGREYLE